MSLELNGNSPVSPYTTVDRTWYRGGSTGWFLFYSIVRRGVKVCSPQKSEPVQRWMDSSKPANLSNFFIIRTTTTPIEIGNSTTRNGFLSNRSLIKIINSWWLCFAWLGLLYGSVIVIVVSHTTTQWPNAWFWCSTIRIVSNHHPLGMCYLPV